MDKEEIISKGYLEAYLTGDLTHEEESEVANLISNDDEARAEFYKIEKLVELLALHHKAEPSPVVKRMIMENSSVMENLPRLEERSSGAWKLMIAASISITTLSVLSAFYFWNQWKTSDLELSHLISQNLEIASNFNRVNNDLNDLREDVSVLISPEYQRIILEGTENSPKSMAVVYWNSINNKVFLNTASMLSLPVNNQYQLWALVNGKPVNAGIFDTMEGRFQVMENIKEANAFAVTIEPEGGSENPTLETLQVIGNV